MIIKDNEHFDIDYNNFTETSGKCLHLNLTKQKYADVIKNRLQGINPELRILGTGFSKYVPLHIIDNAMWN